MVRVLARLGGETHARVQTAVARPDHQTPPHGDRHLLTAETAGPVAVLAEKAQATAHEELRALGSVLNRHHARRHREDSRSGSDLREHWRSVRIADGIRVSVFQSDPAHLPSGYLSE